jgi:hypothetical protein
MGGSNLWDYLIYEVGLIHALLIYNEINLKIKI